MDASGQIFDLDGCLGQLRWMHPLLSLKTIFNYMPAIHRCQFGVRAHRLVSPSLSRSLGKEHHTIWCPPLAQADQISLTLTVWVSYGTDIRNHLALWAYT